MGMLRRKAWAAADAAALGKGRSETMNSIMDLPVYVFLGES